MLSWLVAAALIVAGPAAAQPGNRAVAAPPSYRVTIKAGQPRIQVEARFVLQGARLVMAGNPWRGAPPDGWGFFVEGLKLATPAGQPLVVYKTGPAAWKTEAPDGQAVVLRYEVVLDHDAIDNGRARFPWNFSEAAYRRPWGVFSTAAALFVYQPAMQNVAVSIDAPAGWSAVSSWPAARGGGFTAEDADHLSQGLLVVGDIYRRTTTVEGLPVDLAVGGPGLTAQAPRLQAVAEGSLRYYRKLFGAYPRQAMGLPYSNIALILNEHDQPTAWGGGLAGKDLSLVLGPPGAKLGGDAASLQVTGDAVISHELFHLWNARSFRYASPDESWFSEGVSEFYAYKALHAAGLISDAALLQALAQAYDGYRRDSGFGAMSPRSAGAQKVAHHGLTYHGGWLIGACIDAQLRAQSGGRRSLDDLMRALFQRYDSTSRTYTGDDLLAGLNAVSGVDFSEFFARHVNGLQPVPLAECLSPIGIDARVGQGREATAIAIALGARPALLQGWLGSM
jgi:predicted metalloprotease with PDZ domain